LYQIRRIAPARGKLSRMLRCKGTPQTYMGLGQGKPATTSDRITGDSMPRPIGLLLSALLVAAGVSAARADVVIRVDKTTQRLDVSVDGAHRYTWPVSTARWGYRTPNGTYHPQRLARQWYSRKYDMSPMPHSIFFNGGYAIHGSYEISRLGRPASHGCIRLSPAHAATLFALVQNHRDDTRIVVTGERPSEPIVVRSYRSRPEWREVARTRRGVIESEANFETTFGDQPRWQRPPRYVPGRW
jgi:hypothetical protein